MTYISDINQSVHGSRSAADGDSGIWLNWRITHSLLIYFVGDGGTATRTWTTGSLRA